MRIFNRMLFCLFIFLFTKSMFATPTSHVELADKVMKPCLKELQKDKKMQLVGGGGGYSDDINRLSVHYFYYDKLEIPEARRLYVRIAQTILKRVNEDLAIRPFLHEYPFTIKCLKIIVGVMDSNGDWQGNGLIASFSNRDDRIYYDGFNHEKGRFYNIHSETYEEALKKIAEESSQPCVQ